MKSRVKSESFTTSYIPFTPLPYPLRVVVLYNDLEDVQTMGWGTHEGMGWWMLFDGLWMIVFWGVIVAVAVREIKMLSGRKVSGRREDDLPKIARPARSGAGLSREQLN